MADPTKVDWVDALSGLAVGVASGVFTLYGWFNHKLDAMHGRISTVKQAVNEQASSIKVLEAHHAATLHRLERIEDNSAAINEKQDRQMEILIDIRRAGTQPRRGQ